MEAPILNPQRMGLAEFQRQDWVATAEEGVKSTDLLEPAYWSHVSALMKPFDHIEVRAEDGSWIAELVVLGCDRNWAKVHILQEYSLTDTDVSLTQAEAMKYKVQWKGPHRKWTVIRLSDSQAVKEGFDDKQRALSELRSIENVTG